MASQHSGKRHGEPLGDSKLYMKRNRRTGKRQFMFYRGFREWLEGSSSDEDGQLGTIDTHQVTAAQS